MTALLEARGLNASYGQLQVLWSIDFHATAGEVVVVLGPNGAGKTTLLRALSGLPLQTSGVYLLDGEDVSRHPAHQLARRGLALVPEGRRLFPTLSVEDNLELGAYRLRGKKMLRERKEYVFDLFPVLHERRSTLAGQLSGGEQQMLAVSRGLMSSPKLIMIDEPSLGVSPLVAQLTFQALRRATQEGLAVVMAEQQVQSALKIADRAYVLRVGRVDFSGPAESLIADPTALEQAYFHRSDDLGVHEYSRSNSAVATGEKGGGTRTTGRARVETHPK